MPTRIRYRTDGAGGSRLDRPQRLESLNQRGQVAECVDGIGGPGARGSVVVATMRRSGQPYRSNAGRFAARDVGIQLVADKEDVAFREAAARECVLEEFRRRLPSARIDRCDDPAEQRIQSRAV